MRRLTILAAIAALPLCVTTSLAGDKIKLPTAPANTPRVMTAVDHQEAPVTNVAYGRRAYRRGYYGYGYTPYYAYRPYYGGYGYGYGGYYTRPYYGYSYYAPGWGGYYGGWGPGFGVGIGVAPMARLGGWYW